MTARQKAAAGMKANADNGSIMLVVIVGWLMAEYGFEPPPGVRDAIAGYVVLIGTKIKGML